jgi:hypothetical protein
MKITARVQETIRTVFKFFQRLSKFARCKAVSFSEADSKLKLSGVLSN